MLQILLLLVLFMMQEVRPQAQDPSPSDSNTISDASEKSNSQPESFSGGIRSFLDAPSPEAVKKCEFTISESRHCESCLSKGDECFFCGDTASCLPYQWNFPRCPITEVKYKTCWVNWSALAVVVAIAGGILLVVIFVIFCYCCCKIRAMRRHANVKKANKMFTKEQQKKATMEERHAERRAERESEIDVYRQKYGQSSWNGGYIVE